MWPVALVSGGGVFEVVHVYFRPLPPGLGVSGWTDRSSQSVGGGCPQSGNSRILQEGLWQGCPPRLSCGR